jgi:hypothetical protein
MLEIKSEKYKDLSYVLAAESNKNIHLLIVRTGENQSIQLKESKNVSSSRRIFTLECIRALCPSPTPSTIYILEDDKILLSISINIK